MALQEWLGAHAEKSVPLSTLKHGEVFRLPENDFNESLNEGLFWRVVNAPDKSSGNQVFVVQVEGSETRKFDSDRRVVVHKASTFIER